MRSFFLLLCLFALPLTSVAQTTAEEETPDMTFNLAYPCQDKKCDPVIVATGKIIATTNNDFLAFSEKNRSLLGASTPVVFDSPGGQVLGSLQLGISIRRLGMDTVLIPRTTCLSACVYSFLGGTRRSVSDNSLMAVHRFYSSSGPNGSLDDSQRLISLLGEYVEVMGVHNTFMRVVAQGSEKSLIRINQELAKQLRVDNTNPPAQSWSLSPTDTGLDLMAVQMGLGSDRKGVVTLGMNGKQGVMGVIFIEPGSFQQAYTQKQLEKPVDFILCRVPADETIDKSRCFKGDVKGQWSAVAGEKNTYTTVFPVELKEVHKYLEKGSADDFIVLSLQSEKASRPVLVLRTSARNFTQALRAMTSSSINSPRR